MYNTHQVEILERHYHVYELFLRAGTISNAHHAITVLNNVYEEIHGYRFNQSCGGCVTDALNSLYSNFKPNQS